MLAGHFFRQSFYSKFFDPLKRKLFFLPVRWHAKPLNATWAVVEDGAARELDHWLRPLGGPTLSPAEQASDQVFATPNPFIWTLKSLAYGWMYRGRIAYHLGRMIRGDRATGARIMGFVRTFVVGAGSSSGDVGG